jgi:hypothetical protein
MRWPAYYTKYWVKGATTFDIAEIVSNDSKITTTCWYWLVSLVSVPKKITLHSITRVQVKQVSTCMFN